MRSEIRRIEAKKREWDKSMRGWDVFWKEVTLDIKRFMNFMMFYKAKDSFDKSTHKWEWWFIVFLIYFAIRGLMYTLFGR